MLDFDLTSLPFQVARLRKVVQPKLCAVDATVWNNRTDYRAYIAYENAALSISVSSSLSPSDAVDKAIALYKQQEAEHE